MDMEVKSAAICCLCKCSVDLHEPYKIVKHDYAHVDCADAYDARDLGGMDLPPFAEYDDVNWETYDDR